MSSDVSFPRDNERRGGDVAAKKRLNAPSPEWFHEQTVSDSRSAATRSDRPLVDRLSEELIVALVPHHIDVKPRAEAYDPIRTIVGVTRIPSALRFAAALERAGADATYEAASGWSFRDKRVGNG